MNNKQINFITSFFNDIINLKSSSGTEDIEDIIFPIQEYDKWSKGCRRQKWFNNNCRKYIRSLLGSI